MSAHLRFHAKKRDPEPGLERNSLTKQPEVRTEMTLTDNTDMEVKHR